MLFSLIQSGPCMPVTELNGHCWPRWRPVSSHWLPLAYPTETPAEQTQIKSISIEWDTCWLVKDCRTVTRVNSLFLQMVIWRPDWPRWWVRGPGSERWRRTAWVSRYARPPAGRPGGSPVGSASRLRSGLPGPAGAAWQHPSFPLMEAQWAERRPTPAPARKIRPGSWFCQREGGEMVTNHGIYI